MQLFDYIFNVGGNYMVTINGMTEATGDFSAKVESANNWVGKMTSILAGLDLVRVTVENIHSTIENFSIAGISLDSQMHDLSAVAGVDPFS